MCLLKLAPIGVPFDVPFEVTFGGETELVPVLYPDILSAFTFKSCASSQVFFSPFRVCVPKSSPPYPYKTFWCSSWTLKGFCRGENFKKGLCGETLAGRSPYYRFITWLWRLKGGEKRGFSKLLVL